MQNTQMIEQTYKITADTFSTYHTAKVWDALLQEWAFTSIPKAVQHILRGETCQALLITAKWAAGWEAPKQP